jgi:uncharacterized repeat protein (TIGR03847 family)
MMDMTDTLPTFAALPYYEGDDVYPVTRITAGAVGSPGRRTFVLQAFFGAEPFSWIIEKDQAMALSKAIPELLHEVREEFPELGAPLVAAAPNLTLAEPLQPLFRVGSIGVGYDRLHDLVIFTLVDADTMNGGEEDAAEVDELMDEEASDPPEHQIYVTRGQAQLLGEQAARAVVAGRLLCPRCNAPMDDFGHFCPPANARNRRGGEIMH